MSDHHLHIVSFDIPYPPNYGGVIDVFYKLKALHDAGIKIHLHCYQYRREPAPELESLCYEVHYYHRRTGIHSALGWNPYIVQSRRSPELLDRLTRDSHPILFEGLHTCYYLKNKKLRNRFKIYRESNIEHLYYYHLSVAEKNIFRKLFFISSSLKLRIFQKTLGYADLMLTVSKEDTQYLSKRFPHAKVEYLPSFHHDDRVNSIPGKGDYALYQGKLSVGENYRAAGYLIKEVLSGTDIKLVIAGMNPPDHLKQMIREHPNVTLVTNPDDDEMYRLIREAQVNILVTFQPTGLKLKLLNALFNGRFCLVNPEMTTGTEIGRLCETATGAEPLREKLRELMGKEFTREMISEREEVLARWHSNKENCRNLLHLLSLNNQ